MKPSYFAVLPLAAIFAGACANAANFYWDADSVTAENQNGSGTWNTTNSNWESASTAGVDSQVAWGNTSADTAFLGNAAGLGYTNAATGGTITLGQNIIAGSLSMSSGQSGPYVIDPGAGPYTLTVSSIGNNNTSANLTVNAVVSGTNLIKLNAGKVILTNANTYSGTTTITAGTLSVGVVSGAGSNLGTASSAVTLGGLSNSVAVSGTLSYTGNNATYSRGFILASNGAGGRLDVTTTGQTLTVATAAVTGTGLFTVGGTGNTTISANLTHTGGLTKADAGILTLSGTGNTYSGNTTISAGTLDVGTISAGSLSTSGLLFSGGVLQGNGSFTRAFSGVVTATAGQLSGLTGGFAAKGGALNINFGNTGALVQLSSGAFQFGNGLIFGSATADSKVTVINPLDLNNNSRTITVNSGVGGDSAELQGVVSNTGVNTLTNVFTKAGAGTLILSAANTYTGDTKVTGGTLALTNNLAIQNSALDTSGGGVLNLTGSTTPTFGGLKGSVNLTSVIATGYGSVTSLTLNPGTGATPSYSGVISDGATGMTLIKKGVGTQTLTGANTHTGGTTLTGGKLVLSHNSAAGTAGIAVSGSSTTLEISSGITISNSIIVSNSTASVIHGIAASGAYEVGTSGALQSSFATATPDTAAKILAGTSTGGSTLTMSFSGSSSAANDAVRRSDVFAVGGTGSDLYVIQLTASGLAADSVLGYNNGSIWDLAVTGNTGGNNATLAQQNYAGAFSVFQTNFGSILSDYQGAYGIDTTTNNLWAVVNYGGSFAAVPEPTTALGGLLLGAGLLRRRRGV